MKEEAAIKELGVILTVSMQTIRRTILMMLLVSFLTSCNHYIINEAGYTRPPKNYNFSYKRNSAKLANNEIIDTTAIYYIHNSHWHRGDSGFYNKDEYIRFYADGRFKIQYVKEYPKIADINNINKGLVGYYKLEGSVIKLQIFDDSNGGSDQLEFGLIDENKNIILINENPRTGWGIGFSEKGIRRKLTTSPLNPKLYEKIKLEGMVYEKPNW